MISTTSDWAKYLGTCAHAATPLPSPSGFSDESGHRRAVDLPFLHWLGRDSRSDTTVLSSITGSQAPDVALWASLALGAGIPDHILDFHRASALRSSFDQGSLFPQRDRTGPIALEVWTEVELSSLHAIAWMADRDPGLRSLVRTTARWLVENLQPDNATNHPWAIHIFIALGMGESDSGAIPYAETLLHNCQVSQGHPDAFSSLILRDAADALERSSIATWILDESDDAAV
jgi:hypothetical protein